MTTQTYANIPMNVRVAEGDRTGGTSNGNIIAVPQGHFAGAPNSPDEYAVLQAGGTVSHHVYTWTDGREVMASVRRQEAGSSKKDFSQMHAGPRSADGMRTWNRFAMALPQPPYRLHQLAANPDLPVLFTEGERAADAAAKAYPQYVATTWAGGSEAVNKPDLNFFKDRVCVLWPDNDAAGVKAMAGIARRLHEVGAAQVLMAHQGLDDYPAKWDLADAVPANLNQDRTPLAILQAAQPYTPPKLGRPPKASASSLNDAGAGSEDRFYHAAQHLSSVGVRDYAGQSDWLWIMTAARNTFPANFERFADFSEQHGGDPDERAKWQQRWESYKVLPAGQGIGAGSVFKQAQDNGWVDPNPPAKGGKGKGEKDPAAVVLEQALVAGDEFWMNQQGAAHVTWGVTCPETNVEYKVHSAVGSEAHNELVNLRYRNACPGKVLGGEQERRAMANMTYDARLSNAVHTTWQRAANGDDGSVYLDLGLAAGQVLRVHPSLRNPGWELVANPPVRFVRSTVRTGTIPMPKAGGTREHFTRHFNLGTDDTTRAIAFMLSCWMPMVGAYPLMLLEGGAGTSKSTMMANLLRLVDAPRPGSPATQAPRGEVNLLIHAREVRVVALDNLSGVDTEYSNTLCQLVYGVEKSKRELQSDGRQYRIHAHNPVVLNGILNLGDAQDFLSRVVRVNALPVKHRLDEETLTESLEEDLPYMVDFMIQLVHESLTRLPEMKQKVKDRSLKLPRLSAFALRVEAAHRLLGLEEGEFSSKLEGEQKDMQSESTEGSALGDAILRHFSARNTDRSKPLRGTGTEVLDKLRSSSSNPKGLPSSNKLQGELRAILPGLEDLSVRLRVDKAGSQAGLRKTLFTLSVTSDFQPIGTTYELLPDADSGEKVVQLRGK